MTTIDLATLDHQLNTMLLGGELLAAFDRFYADDVDMQENADPPTLGKAANRERELQFLANAEQVHEVSLVSAGIGDGVTFSEWVFDITFKGGFRARTAQVAVRRWRDGLIVHERFYYKPAM